MKRSMSDRLLAVIIAAMIAGIFLVGFIVGCAYKGSVHAHAQVTSVCYLTGLSGPAEQENLLYCANGTQLATSTYLQAIHLAQEKHIIIGTPTMVTETVNWANVPVTYVTFTSGFHAWHFNPSNGVATIDDPYDNTVYSGR